jgi:hydrogenase assembly chaperone HypC/HupF
MCMAAPAQVMVVSDDRTTAEVVARGREQRVLLVGLDETARPVVAGDWLLVHSGLALGRIDAAEAAGRALLLDEVTGGES